MKLTVDHQLLRVFYRDYANDVRIASSQPESLSAERISALAARLLEHPDNFLGVVDRNDVILQCYLAEQDDGVVLEMVYPEATGCLRLVMTIDQALSILQSLPLGFDESLLPGAQYIA
jgi:hypothetical protein